METLELEYTDGVEFVCPLAETMNCKGKNDGTYKTRKGLLDHIQRHYKTRKGLVDHIHRKHSAV